MTKVSFSRMFDVALMQGSKVAEELAPFLDYFNQFADNVARILRKGVSITDNLDADTITLKMANGTANNYAISKTPIAVLVAKQVPASPAITAFAWSINGDGQLSLTVTYTTAPTTNPDVTFIVLYS